jgi:hypothetical protein
VIVAQTILVGVRRGEPSDEADQAPTRKGELRMVVLVVVLPEEGSKPGTSMNFARESPGMVRLILHGLELRPAEGVVVRDVRAAEARCTPSVASNCARVSLFIEDPRSLAGWR